MKLKRMPKEENIQVISTPPFLPDYLVAGMIQLLEAGVWHPTSNHTDASNIDLATKNPTKLKTEYEQNY